MTINAKIRFISAASVRITDVFAAFLISLVLSSIEPPIMRISRRSLAKETVGIGKSVSKITVSLIRVVGKLIHLLMISPAIYHCSIHTY